jgi:diguanylate cyclase (GGDEF)-like protein
MEEEPRVEALSPVALPAWSSPAASRPRLLIVDDQAVNVQALYHAFAADHQVFVATGGVQAEKLARAKRPDLVLLDIVMPDIDGYEVCRRLKADPETRDIPVIFVTGQDDEEAETRGLDVGAVDFITKPINPRIVRARVRTHLTLKWQSDQLRQIALVDGLTSLYNRRHFDDVLARESQRAARSGQPLSVLMLDVDHFKRYNDRYGHGAGDECLRRVAAVLAATMKRPGDLVARYGGEEFVCVLPETEHTGALAVAAMLEERVRGLQMPHADSPTAPVATVSIGVATTGNGFAGDAQYLLSQADAALYRAKLAGRARVEGGEPVVAV